MRDPGSSRPLLAIIGQSWDLGPHPEVTLSMARQKARELKEQIRQGIDPRVTKKISKSMLLAEQAKSVTFRTVSDMYLKKTLELKTSKQVQKLSAHLKTYAYTDLGKLLIGDIERAVVSP